MIIFIYGRDTWRAKEKLKELKDEFIKKHDKTGLNVLILEGELLSSEGLNQAVRASALLGDKRLIIIKNLSGSRLETDSIGEVFEKKPENNIVIIYEEKPEKDLKNYFKILEPRYKYCFDPLVGKDLENWISRTGETMAVKLQRGVVLKLIEACSNDLWKLRAEIKKLAIYFSQNEASRSPDASGRGIQRNSSEALISIGAKENKIASAEEDIEHIIIGQAESGIFRFLDSLGTPRKTLVLLQNELEAGTAPEQILGMIAWQARKTGARLRVENLKKTYSKLLDIDVKIKTGVASPENLLAIFVASK